MFETVNLGLQLLAPSQAQKHVTVNESLVRIDALTQITLKSRSMTSPPLSPTEGDSYAVPASAIADWAGKGGLIALAGSSGWDYIQPKKGWRGWIGDEVAEAIFDGTSWRTGVLTLSAGGASATARNIEFDHTLVPGTVSIAAARIPANTLVLAVSVRVIGAVTGTLSSWSFGSTGNPSRFGSAIGLAVGSYSLGLLSSPTAYYAATDLLLTPTSGQFSGGIVRISLNLIEILPPT